MAHIAYRTMMCGWSLEDSEQEVARHFGLVSVNHGPDYRHMQKFFDERVVPYRLAQKEKAKGEAETMARTKNAAELK
jgi:hypothetical protein